MSARLCKTAEGKFHWIAVRLLCFLLRISFNSVCVVFLQAPTQKSIWIGASALPPYAGSSSHLSPGPYHQNLRIKESGDCGTHLPLSPLSSVHVPNMFGAVSRKTHTLSLCDC